MMRGKRTRWLAVLVAALTVAAGACAAAAEGEKDETVAAAAARCDAFVNLTRRLYALQVSQTRTLGSVVAAGGRTRDQVEAALRGAYPVDGPSVDDFGVAHVTIELKTLALPYELRYQIRDLPRTIRADGAASRAAAEEAATAPPGQISDEVKAWAESTLDAEGDSAISSGPKPEVAKTEARRQAIARALDILAKKVDALKLDSDTTVQGFLEQHEDLRAEVYGTITGATLLSESIDRLGTTYKVKVTLSGRALLRPLRLGRFREAQATKLTPDQVDLARTNACLAGRERFKKRLLELPLSTGVTLGKYVETRANLKAEIESICQQVPTERVEITDAGLAKAHFTLFTKQLPREIQGMLVQGTEDRISVVGGGLPAERKKTDERDAAEKPPEPSKKQVEVRK